MLICQSKVTGQRVCVTQNRIVLLFSHSHFRERVTLESVSRVQVLVSQQSLATGRGYGGAS